MKIGIDIDGPIVDYMGGFCNFYNPKYGTNFSIEDFKTHDIWEIVGGTRVHAVKLVKEFYETDLFDNIGLIKGAEESIKKLYKDNHDLHVITARWKFFKDKTEAFFKKNFEDVPLPIFYTGFFGGGKKKAKVCKKLGIELMIEDSKKYAFNCVEVGVRVLLFDKPWNQGDSLLNNITRVYNWNEILDKIENMKNEHTRIF